jgi:hypothetical protein
LTEHVFGYASLVGAPAARRLVTLRGHRRFWGVAMDNRVAVPGYKVYEAPDGRRPAVAVAFLDLAPAKDAAVDGALLEVDDDALADLDARERQYRRADVTAAIEPAPPAGARVWTYVGRDEGRERVRRGRRGGGPVVIQRAYAELVDRAYRALGAERHARYLASTEAPPFPLRDLARIDLPA